MVSSHLFIVLHIYIYKSIVSNNPANLRQCVIIIGLVGALDGLTLPVGIPIYYLGIARAVYTSSRAGSLTFIRETDS